LTAQRRQEIGGLRWDEIDFQNATISLGPERTKNRQAHELPLSPVALAILQRQVRISEFVFGLRPFNNWARAKAELPELTAPFVLHDLRRSAATGMANLGVLPHVIETVLNHVGGHKAGVAGVYNRATYAKEMRSALEKWAAHVEAITG
jgi:integrase